MTKPVTTRRDAMKLGAISLAGLTAPLRAEGQGGFTHGVASGEPGQDRVLLWTRYKAASATRLKWEVASDEAFSRIVARGRAVAAPQNDCCTKVVASGLEPGRWYHYRFTAPNGAVSMTGRTRTLPEGKVPRFRMAVFSCSNFGFGWFNAYAHACEADEFDLAVHLGDYYYEYKRGKYPDPGQGLDERVLPLDEATTLARYRERLATYRADPDLQRLHQRLPMIAMWDDHEVANDTWKGGAENHQSDEGDFAVRKAASERAWREWMPVSDAYWVSYEIGDLASLYKLESRHLARDRQLSIAGTIKAAPPGEAVSALAAFRDGTWRDPARTLLGSKQEGWLGASLAKSVQEGKPWQVVAQEIVMGSLILPDVVSTTLPEKAPPVVRNAVGAFALASKAGLPYNMDAWDGYPAARERLFKAAVAAEANLVVLSGDSHNAWAFDLDLDGKPVGVEMAGHSVTSPGAESEIPWVGPATLADEMVKRNRQLKWCDTARRGYMAVELTPEAATGEWRFLQTVRERGTALAGTQTMTVKAGSRRFG